MASFDDAARCIAEDDAEGALVLLWQLAQAHDGQDRQLNTWVDLRNQVPDGYSIQPLIAALQRSEAPSPDALAQDPLGWFEALDEYLARWAFSPSRPTPVPVVVGDAEYWVIPCPLPRRRNALYTKQLDKIHGWLKHHWIVPAKVTVPPGETTFRITASRVNARVWSEIERETDTAPRWRMGVVHFSDGIDTTFTAVETGLLATGLSDESTRSARVLQAIDEAEAQGIQVLVLPELTITPAQRVELQAHLSRRDPQCLQLVVAGSFHENRNGRTYNVSDTLSRTGARVLEHKKLARFTGQDLVAEAIALGDEIQLLLTPAGAVVTPICRDFCDDGLAPLWTTAGADWYLVPSMSDSVTAHREASRRAERNHNACSVVANQAPPGVKACPGYLHPEHGSGARGDLTFGDRPLA